MASTVPHETMLRRYGVEDSEIKSMSEADKATMAAEALSHGIHAGDDPPMAGSRSAPVEVKNEDDLRRAEAVVHPNPSPAQAEAENYRHGHIELPELGLTGAHSISIETAAGGTRKGPINDRTGEPEWLATMGATYGRIKGTKGADGEPLDIFVGPEADGAANVLIIDQADPVTRQYDEHKIFARFAKPIDAVNAYVSSHDESGPDRIGGMRRFTIDEFREWMKGDTTRPVSDAMRSASDDANDRPSPPETDGGQETEAETPTPQHRQAVEDTLRATGGDPSRVRPEDLDHAAKIHAEEGVPAEHAFPVAMLRSLVRDGHINPDDARKELGDEGSKLLEPGIGGPSGGIPSPEAPSPGAPGEAAEAASDLAQGGVAAGAQSRGQGGEAPVAEAPKGHASGSQSGRGAVDRTASGQRGAKSREHRQDREHGKPFGKPEAATGRTSHEASRPSEGDVKSPHRSILEFIVHEGGLKSTQELRLIGVSKMLRVKTSDGSRNVVQREGGMTVPDLFEKLKEAKYLSGDASDHPYAQVRDMIAAEMRRTKVK